ncbi:MAG: hypothetical protein FJX67_00290 [Alphaproteobacteria bacterium]|nr:hypothetical protein [Alphaproteobacteria bacterium]
MRIIIALGFVLSVLFGAVSSADAQTKLRLLSSWNKTNWPAYAAVDYYQKYVHEMSKGAIQITIFADDVVPPFQQLQPVSSGVFDMLFTHGVYHAGAKGIALVLDAIDHDPDKRRASGVWEFVSRYYQRHHNLRAVAIPAASNHGYHVFLREPLSPAGDWAGRKIRGTQSYHGVIRALGGSPVVLPPGEIYTALEKGVVEGAAWPAAGMLSMKHYEVAKFRVRPTFGTSNEPILINIAKWGTLTPAEQQVLLDAGLRLEREMPALGDAILKNEDVELAKLGVKDLQLSPEKAELVKKVWSESLWELAKQCCGDGAPELREIALKAGMTK